MRSALLTVALVGCGRFGFDSLGEASSSDGMIDSPADAAVDPALIAFYPFDDDPTDGVDNRAVGFDLAHCALACPSVVQGKHGAAYRFNGTSTSIIGADFPQLHMTTGTVALWVNFAALPGNDSYMSLIGKPWGVGSFDSFEIFLVGTLTIPKMYAGGDANGGLAFAQEAWFDGSQTWIHVAMTWDGTTTTLYRNGTELDTAAQFPLAYDGAALVIGADFNNGAYDTYLQGDLDEVVIFSRALSAGEIALLAQ